MKITVEKRNDDYIAFINDDRRLWGNGKTPYEAVGNCVVHHTESLNLEPIEWKGVTFVF